MSQIIAGLSSIVAIAAGTTVLVHLYLKIRKIFKFRADQKELERNEILEAAREIAHKYKKELEAKIELLQRDLEYVKQSHTSEMKFVAEKIEELRDEVRTNLSQIVVLVSKLIDRGN